MAKANATKPAPLNAEQLQIVQAKEVTLTRPVNDLIALLTPIAAADAAGDKARQRNGCLCALAFVIGVILIFVNTVPFHFILSALFILGGVALIFVIRKEKAEDISNNLAKCAVPLLVALRDDFGSEPVELKLDLRSPTAPEKKVGEQKVDKKTITHFNDPWFSCDGVLADGSRLRCSVVDTIIQSRYWKKTSSGKQKLKTKSKTKADIDVELTLRTKTYSTGEAAAGEKKTTLSASVKNKRAGADPLPPGVIIDVIAGLYSQVRPAR
jgi:hypothetical protein